MKLESLKTPQTAKYYEGILQNKSSVNLKKFKDFVDLINEGAELIPSDFRMSDPAIFINSSELASRRIFLSDAVLMRHLFSEDLDRVLPSQITEKERDAKHGIYIRLPIDENNKIPYGTNFKNFELALKKIFTENRKTEPVAIEQNTTEALQTKPTLQYLIRKVGMDYYIADKPLRFDNTDAIYFKIFNILFENRDASDFCSYETINRKLESDGEKRIEDRAKIVERISNGLKNLYRYSHLFQKSRGGEEIIKTKRGKGLILYNPPIN